MCIAGSCIGGLGIVNLDIVGLGNVGPGPMSTPSCTWSPYWGNNG